MRRSSRTPGASCAARMTPRNGDRDDRLPARQDRPHDQCHEADCTDRAQRSAQCGAVWAARQQNVRSQQDQTGDRNAAMPDRGPVDPVEPFLDPWKRADEHEGDREQEDRLRTQELSDIASGRFSRGSSDEPHEGPNANDEHDRRGSDFPSDEPPVHAEDPTPRTAGLSVHWAPGALRVFSAERLRLVVCHLGGAGRSSPFGTETLL